MEPDSGLSPRLMRKAIHAAVAAESFERAADALEILAEVSISARRLGRLVKRIGDERVAEVQQEAEAYQALPLPARQTCPLPLAPEVVCVQCDGGRMQIRDRQEKQRRETGYWRETKVAALLKLRSVEHACDPCPPVPEIFVDPHRAPRLAREIKGFSGNKAPLEPSAEEFQEPADVGLPASALHAQTRPQPVLRSVVASIADIREFGEQVVAAAHARGFHAAQRKAFVGDGMACNWTLHEKHFSHYTPILDFVHALCYVYQAAMAGRSAAESWCEYAQWAQWLWGGQIERLIEAMKQRQEALGVPKPDDGESSSRHQLADALGYLQNQKSRMDYPSYRQQGLPITSAYIESTIKQLNRRVKGTEKFWSTNAAAIVQLRADFLSETKPLDAFWKRRRNNLTSNTQYQLSG